MLASGIAQARHGLAVARILAGLAALGAASGAAADAVLWNNGPLVNEPFAGAGGSHASRVQSELGLTAVGYGGGFDLGPSGFSFTYLADDFVVDTPGGWDVGSLTFFAMPVPASGMVPPANTRISLSILLGPPWGTNTVVFQGSASGPFPAAGIYRVPGDDLGSTAYPVNARTVPVGQTLPPGHYWISVELDAGAGGLFKSWVPPVTRSGETVTGDAYSYSSWCYRAAGCGGHPWQPIEPSPGGVGLPFVITGNPAAAKKGDLDGQGGPDLVLRNANPGSADYGRHKVWFMNGTARTDAQFVTPDAGPQGTVVGVDDFDTAGAPWNGPDGTADLVMLDASTRAVEFWLMNGATRVGAPLPLAGTPRAPEWLLAATADFDHDARPDLLWRNLTTRKIEIWTLRDTVQVGTVVPSPDQALADNWNVVAAQDYNGDGHTDLLWYNVTSGKVVSWYMDSAVTRISGQFLNPPSVVDNNWRVVASADLSRSQVPGTPPFGSPDVVWRNETSGRLVVWHLDLAGNRVFGEFTSPASESAPLDWTVVGPR